MLWCAVNNYLFISYWVFFLVARWLKDVYLSNAVPILRLEMSKWSGDTNHSLFNIRCIASIGDQATVGLSSLCMGGMTKLGQIGTHLQL